MRILAISGSLRAVSSNTAVLQAAQLLAPPDVEITLYERLGELPHFNPDLDIDGGSVPPAVLDLRARVGRADGLLISSPEYAHGVPGAMKNALDWLVASVEFPGKPVALLSASARSIYVQAALVEILTTMSARLIADASVTVPVVDKTVGAAAMAADPAIASVLRDALGAFVRAIATQGAAAIG